MKKDLIKNIIVYSIYGAIVAWSVASLINTNMANVGEVEIAAWNMFELASNLVEGIKA